MEAMKSLPDCSSFSGFIGKIYFVRCIVPDSDSLLRDCNVLRSLTILKFRRFSDGGRTVGAGSVKPALSKDEAASRNTGTVSISVVFARL